jgi:carbohydrate-binding DOMON domain-containing protein
MIRPTTQRSKGKVTPMPLRSIPREKWLVLSRAVLAALVILANNRGWLPEVIYGWFDGSTIDQMAAFAVMFFTWLGGTTAHPIIPTTENVKTAVVDLLPVPTAMVPEPLKTKGP